MTGENVPGMNAVMSKPRKPAAPPEPQSQDKAIRPRLAIDTTDRVLRAIELRAIAMSAKARRVVGKSEAANVILEEALAPELAEVDREDLPPRRPRRKQE